MVQFLNCLHFFEHHAFFLCSLFEANSGGMENLASRRHQQPLFFAYRHRCSTVSCACFGSPFPPTHCGSTRVLCSCSFVNSVSRRGGEERWAPMSNTHPPLMHMPHCPLGIHLQNTNSKIKLLTISR